MSLIWGIIPKVGDTIWAGEILFNSNYLVVQEKEKNHGDTVNVNMIPILKIKRKES